MMTSIDDVEDVLPLRRPARWQVSLRVKTAAAVLAALLAGLAIGYTVGPRHQPAPISTAHQPSATVALTAAHVDSQPISETGQVCSTQHNVELQLGFEIQNTSTVTVALQRLVPVLPLGGLRPIGEAVGSCGQLSPAQVSGSQLPAGGTQWLSATFAVLVDCPGFVPVEFDLSYLDHGHATTVHLSPFPDLGSVPYTGCTSGSTR